MTSADEPGFKIVRARIIRCLETRRFRHEFRHAIGEKNLLQSGAVTRREVIDFLNRCRGHQYQTGRHHWDSSVVVHIFQPRHSGTRWYIKAYFLEVEPGGEITVFLSVHPSEGG